MWETSDKFERRMLIQAEIRREVAQGRAVKAVQVEPQGNWTKWKIPERTLSWQELWTYEPLLLSSLLLYVYDYTSKHALMEDDLRCHVPTVGRDAVLVTHRALMP